MEEESRQGDGADFLTDEHLDELLLRVADSPAISRLTAEKLLDSNIPEVKRRVILNTRVPFDWLRGVLPKEDKEIFEALSEKSGVMPEEFFTKLVFGKFDYDVGERSEFPLKLMDRVITNPGSSILLLNGLAKNKKLTAMLALKLLNCENSKVRANLVRNQKLPERALKKITNDVNEVIEALIEKDNLSKSTIEKLSKSSNNTARKAMAAREDLADYLVYNLAWDRAMEVRKEIARRRILEKKTIDHLAQDPSSEVKDELFMSGDRPLELLKEYVNRGERDTIRAISKRKDLPDELREIIFNPYNIRAFQGYGSSVSKEYKIPCEVFYACPEAIFKGTPEWKGTPLNNELALEVGGYPRFKTKEGSFNIPEWSFNSKELYDKKNRVNTINQDLLEGVGIPFQAIWLKDWFAWKKQGDKEWGVFIPWTRREGEKINYEVLYSNIKLPENIDNWVSVGLNGDSIVVGGAMRSRGQSKLFWGVRSQAFENSLVGKKRPSFKDVAYDFPKEGGVKVQLEGLGIFGHFLTALWKDEAGRFVGWTVEKSANLVKESRILNKEELPKIFFMRYIKFHDFWVREVLKSEIAL